MTVKFTELDRQLTDVEMAYIVEAALSAGSVTCAMADCQSRCQLWGLWFYDGFDPMCIECVVRLAKSGELPPETPGRWILMHDSGHTKPGLNNAGPAKMHIF